MRNRFPGYYRPSEPEFTKLWTDCLFVPDTNILLHLFRYGEKTRGQVLDTLRRLQPRVWIPYRVGFEFQRRWRDVDQTNRDAYDKLSRDIESQGRQLAGLFDVYKRHQIIDVDLEKGAIDKFINELCGRLGENKAKHPTRKDADDIFLSISTLIGDSVGECPSAGGLEELRKEGEAAQVLLACPGIDRGGELPADATAQWLRSTFALA